MKLRAPWDCLAECVWLARLTDKARLMKKGQLPPDYAMLLGHPRGIDGRFLGHFGFDKDSTLEILPLLPDDESVERWFRAQAGVTADSIRSWNDLAPNLGKSGWPGERELAFAIQRFCRGPAGNSAVETLFELIRLDENLPLPSCHASVTTNPP